jgi:hypothetical protein
VGPRTGLDNVEKILDPTGTPTLTPWPSVIHSAVLPSREYFDCYSECEEPGVCSQHSNWLQAGQRRGRSSSPCRVKNFLFSTS